MVEASTTMAGMVPQVSVPGIITVAIWFFVGIILLAAIGLFIWAKIRNSRYGEYKVVIYEKDSTGNVHEYYDRAGVFINKKTNVKALWLERFKRGLDPNQIPYVTAKDKKGRLVKTVYLLRTGVSNFRYIKVGIDNIPGFTVGEEDLNWATNEWENIKNAINKENPLKMILAIGVFIIVCILILILMLNLTGKFSTIKEATENMVKIAETQERTTAKLNNLTEAIAHSNGIATFPGDNTPQVRPSE